MKFFIKNKIDVNESFELTESVVSIGAGSANAIVINDDDLVAENHMQFVANNNEYMVVDLGSANGTFVNSEKVVGSRMIKNGDEISIGNKTFSYEIEDNTKNFVQFSPSNGSGEKVINETNPATKTVTFKPAAVTSNKSRKGEAEESISEKDNVFAQKTQAEANQTVVDGFDEKELFSKGKAKKPKEKKALKKRIFDIFFYIIVLVLASIAVYSFIIMQNKKTPSKQKQIFKEKPFFLSYEKVIETDNNIFNFRLEVKGYKVEIILDDLLSQRNYSKDLVLNDSDGTILNLDKLKKSIGDTDFAKLKKTVSSEAVVDTKTFRRIKLYQAGVLTDYTATDEYPPSSFIAVENAIDDFVTEMGYSSFPKSPKELQEEAKEMFLAANDYFDNWRGAPGNLLAAKVRYERAIEFLNQFEPKPIMWKRSKARLAECTKLLEERIKSLKKDYNKAKNLKQLDEKLRCLKELLLLTPKDSKDYKEYLRRKRITELAIKKRRGK